MPGRQIALRQCPHHPGRHCLQPVTCQCHAPCCGAGHRDDTSRGDGSESPKLAPQVFQLRAPSLAACCATALSQSVPAILFFRNVLEIKKSILLQFQADCNFKLKDWPLTQMSFLRLPCHQKVKHPGANLSTNLLFVSFCGQNPGVVQSP